MIQQAAQHDYFGFAKVELEHRRQMRQPPYAHLARIVVRGPQEADVQVAIRQLADQIRGPAAQLTPAVKVLGPAPAPILKLRRMFRFHMLLSAEQPGQIAELWHQVRGSIHLPEELELTIDVDPIEMR